MIKNIRLFPRTCLLLALGFQVLLTACSKHNTDIQAATPAVTVGMLSPSRGPQGTVVTIDGAGFSDNPALDSVYFNGKSAVLVSGTATQLVVQVPDSGSTGPVTVHVSGARTTGPVFTYGAPLTINSLSPAGGPAGIKDTIRGKGFGSSLSSVGVIFNGVSATVVSVNDSMVVAVVPANAGVGKVKVTIDREQVVQGPVFNFLVITSLSPSTGVDGSQDTITGTGFSTTLSQDSVKFNGFPAKLISASPTMLVAIVPAGSGTGTVSVTLNGNTVVGPVYTNLTPRIDAAQPTSGPISSFVKITGVGFVSSDTVFFNGIPAPTLSTSAGNGVLYASAPAGFSSGNITVGANGNYLTGPLFTVTATGVSTPAGSNKRKTLDGTGIFAAYRNVFSVTADKWGNVYSIEAGNNYSYSALRKMGPDGKVGTLLSQSPDGNSFASAVADSKGNVYILGNNNVAMVDTLGNYSVIAGDPGRSSGFTDGQGTAALFNNNGSGGIAIDPAGNLYVVDLWNSVIRKITPSGLVSTPYPASFYGSNTPFGVAVDASGDLYFTSNSQYNGSDGVFEITTNGVLHTLAVSLSNNPMGIGVDASGNVYFNFGNQAIYQYAAGSGAAPTLLAGSDNQSGSLDGTLNTALFNLSDNNGGGITVDAQGNIFGADDTTVRKVTLH